MEPLKFCKNLLTKFRTSALVPSKSIFLISDCWYSQFQRFHDKLLYVLAALFTNNIEITRSIKENIIIITIQCSIISISHSNYIFYVKLFPKLCFY